MTEMRSLAVLGATGSIGLSTLDVVARHPDRFRVHALAANTDVAGMVELCHRHHPAVVVMADEAAARALREELACTGLAIDVEQGTEALEAIASDSEVSIVVAAIVGAAGLLPTLAAARTGKRVLLANKEALVMAGALFMDAVRDGGAELLPIDSEHNAIFQCLPPGHAHRPDEAGVERILLTASGGPFRTRDPETLHEVTPDEACAHPNWSMGRKISVDSATMMNKGLEVIEACWLFGVGPERIEVVIHPQSVIHSLVRYVDGSVLAQMGQPDMRTPIAHALGWPERIESGAEPLDLVAVARLNFEQPDPARFPCLELAFEAARAGGSHPAVLNAANEVAVSAFLDGHIRFTDIPRVIQGAMERTAPIPVDDLESILEADRLGREAARLVIRRITGEPA